MPGEMTDKEKEEQERMEAEEKAQAEQAAKEKATKEQEDRGDEFSPTVEDKELDAAALTKIAVEDDDDAKKKAYADTAAAEAKKKEDDAKQDEDLTGVDEIDKRIKIPKYRLDREVEKRQKVEEENARLKAYLEAVNKSPTPAAKDDKPKEEVKPYDFEDAEKRYADALIEGDKDAAAKIRTEIRNAEEKTRETKDGEKNAEIATRQALENEAAAIATKMFKEYPFFDSTAANHSKQALKVFLAVRNEAFRTGVPFPQAVQQAFDEVGPAYAHLMGKSEDQGKTPEELAADKEKANAIKEKRATEEKAKAADASGKQPANLKGSTPVSGKKIEVKDLTDEQYDSLPAAEKARLRGDNV